jgi:hypothetical protein
MSNFLKSYQTGEVKDLVCAPGNKIQHQRVFTIENHKLAQYEQKRNISTEFSLNNYVLKHRKKVCCRNSTTLGDQRAS